MEKISIIVPAYNVEKYIAETIESLLKQSYKNLEIIIINDGSTDRTAEILDEYKNKYANFIKVFTQKNQGQSVARNSALQYVTGEYLCFMDADDILYEECLERLVEGAKKGNAEIVICGYEKFDDTTKEILSVRNPIDWQIGFNCLKHVFHYSPCAKLFKTEFVRKYDLTFSVGEQLEDGPYSALADLLATNVVVLDYIGYGYRIYSNSTMGNIRKKNNKPKPPYNGVITLIEKFNAYNKNREKEQVMEFCVVKILTGFVTNMYKSCDKETRKQLCSYSHEIMKKYFPHIKKNPYIKLNKLKKLPLTHRVAVRLFVFFDSFNLLYPFSMIVSRIL